MDWAILIFEILLAVAVFLIGLFVKNYLPSYMDEKGKNLATKEDIEEITRKTEEVQKEFREGFELFSNDVKFKYDFFYKQYSELYCKLYAIIIQSEYVRHFIELTDKRTISFEEAPFLEITPTHKETTTFNISKANGSSVTRKTEEIETPISQFNKYYSYDRIRYTSTHNDGHQIPVGHSNRHYNGHSTNQFPEIFHSSSLPPSSSGCAASYSLIPFMISAFAFSISVSLFFFLDLK